MGARCREPDRPWRERRTLITTDPARADLGGIAADSPQTAERFVTRPIASLHRIARDWLRPGLGMHAFGKYCAYFRVTDEHLIVVRSSRYMDAIIFNGETE